jgi:hypothetical protein
MASNSISEITSYFSSGFQRINKFDVSFTRQGVTGGQAQQSTQFWASQCQIPQQYIVWYPETFSPSGPTIHIPLKREYDDRFIIDFIVDSNWSVRKYFELWCDSMFSSVISGKSNTVNPRNTPANLSNIIIKALKDGSTGPAATITVYDAYPKLILPSQFSNDTPNQYLTLSVDFNYRYYRTT